MAIRGRNNLSGEIFFFITTTVIQHIQVFTEDEYSEVLIKNIKYYQEKFQFDILAYVIMPSHFHWIVEINPKKGTISDVMRDIKKHSAWDIMDLLKTRNKKDVLKIFEINAKDYKDRNRKFWMKRFDDQVIRDQRMFWTKLKYIHNNPVKAGLVERPDDYKYSSARNYILEDHSIIKINTQIGGIIIE